MQYIAICIIFILILLFSPAKIRFVFKKESFDEYLEVETTYFTFLKVTFKIPEMLFQIKNLLPVILLRSGSSVGKHNSLQNIEEIYLTEDKYWRHVGHIQDILAGIERSKSLFKLFPFPVISELGLFLDFGHGDPHITAGAVGVIYSLSYIILAFANKYIKLNRTKVKIKVNPSFAVAKPLKIDLNGIINARVGHIIIATFFTLRLWWIVKYDLQRKGKGEGSHGRASH